MLIFYYLDCYSVNYKEENGEQEEETEGEDEADLQAGGSERLLVTP